MRSENYRAHAGDTLHYTDFLQKSIYTVYRIHPLLKSCRCCVYEHVDVYTLATRDP